MTKLSIGLLIAGLTAAQGAMAADVDFAALVQRLPAAIPADAATALKTQAAGTAAALALKQDIDKAGEAVSREQANRLFAGTGMAPGSDDAAAQQARMQAMAQQMQGMSQQQQIAMALQMQQQVQANMGMQAAIMSPAEQQAMAALAQDPQRSNELMQTNMQTLQRVTALRQAADAQHQQIRTELDKAIAATQKMTLGSNAACVAQARQQKQLVVEAGNRHIAVADKLLGQMQPVYADYRKRAGDELQHMNLDISLAAKIKNGAMQKQAAQSVSTAKAATLSATQSALEFYRQSFDEAHWVQDRDRAAAQELPTGCGGEGG